MNPSSGKLFMLLKKAYTQHIAQDVRRLLDKNSKAFLISNEDSVPPFCFRASIPEITLYSIGK